ncbi:hypothetical protein ACFP1I_07635 [Dyadobacter subterraneus]|uniref:Uncharacterized protein n=1 Tax=Dyadobacter subterraneus TaxID=2773304 RepID=A0ABR9WES1_9BACT|nr:hypothetical protein [Dyadobacter subterraneus]MBE9463995.1 hypothetical protein [Dyadobacter subterraneus]
MKKIKLIFYHLIINLIILNVLINVSLHAQVKTKLNTSKAATANTKVNQPGFSMQLSATDMVSLANAAGPGDLSLVLPDKKGNFSYTGLSEEQATQAKEKQISDALFGNGTPATYGITYSSAPVKKAYDNYIAPYVVDFLEQNDEIYKGGVFNMIIASKIADQLILCAENTNVYTTYGSRDKLRKEIMVEFLYDPFPDESKNADYYEDHLVNIYNRTSTGLNSCIGSSMSCNDDRSNSFFFMTGFAAKNNCAIATIIAKSNIETIKINSKLTDDLQMAKIGIFFRPLLDYKNQNSAFEIHTIKMKALQTATKEGTLYTYYDKDNKCPSPLAYGFLGMGKPVRTASILNTLK